MARNKKHKNPAKPNTFTSTDLKQRPHVKPQKPLLQQSSTQPPSQSAPAKPSPSTSTFKPSQTNPSTSNPAYNLLLQSHSPKKSQEIFTEKILHRPLLLKPSSQLQSNTNTASKTGTSTSTSTNNSRLLRRHIRIHKSQYHTQHARPRPLSAKDRRLLKLHELKPQEINYKIYLGLHRLWLGYIREILGIDSQNDNEGKIVTAQSHGSLLCSAEFTGMMVQIVRSRDVGRVGLRGIVIRESMSLFVIVTKGNRVVNIPKGGSVFRVVVPFSDDGVDDKGEDDKGGEDRGDGQKRQLVFDLLGSQIEIRPADRATRKFKWNPGIIKSGLDLGC